MKKEKKNKKIDLKKTHNKKIISTIVLAVVLIITIVVIVVVLLNMKKKVQEEVIDPEFAWVLDGEGEELYNDNVFNTQNKIYTDIMNEYKKGDYTYDNPYVVINPSMYAPQTAMLLFKTDKKEKITLTVKGKNDNDLVKTFEASKDHYIPVYGLYGAYNNTVIIETESGKKHTEMINIPDAISMPADIDIEVNEIKDKNNDEFYFATSSLGYSFLLYDNYGEVRWRLGMSFTKGMTMLQNGHILLSTSQMGPDVTSTNGVIEIDMLGFVYHKYELEGGYHHDAYEMPNGNLLVLTTNPLIDQSASSLAEIDRNTGKTVKTWDMAIAASEIDRDLIEEGEVTWAWMNSVYYDEANKAIILSLRNQNSVVSVDYESSKINWILGDEKYWSDKFSQYMLKGVGSDFVYPGGQHSVYITDDGYLSIMNNGYDADRETKKACSNFKTSESYAMQYKLDLDNMTAEVVWKFGGHDYFSYALSSLTYTKEKNKVINFGWHFANDALYDDPNCTQITNDLYDTYLFELDKNNNVVLKMRIDESKFEIIKASVYNLEAVSVKPKILNEIPNYKFEGGTYLTDVTYDEYEKLNDSELKQYKNAPVSVLSFGVVDNRLSFIGNVDNDRDVFLIFIAANGDGYKVPLTNNGYVIPNIDLSSLPKNKYYIYVNDGELIFNSTSSVTIS